MKKKERGKRRKRALLDDLGKKSPDGKSGSSSIRDKKDQAGYMGKKPGEKT